MRKGMKQEGFDIKYGGWIAPTCCSMLVNIIQWLLTYQSIMLYKGDNSAFWLPELVRGDLELEFKKIQDVNHFWHFTENVIGEYIFETESLIDKSTIKSGLKKIDINKLNSFDKSTLSKHSRGRIFVGPMRFLQKRVKPLKKCKRSSIVKRYAKVFEQCYPL